MKNIVLAVLLTITLAGCAETSQIVVGNPRAAIAESQVKIYVDPPGNYQKIAILDSAATNGFDNQHNTDLIMADLKKKAAALGANGILILNTDADTRSTSGWGTGFNNRGTTGWGFFGGHSRQAKVKAMAIYVRRK